MQKFLLVLLMIFAEKIISQTDLYPTLNPGPEYENPIGTVLIDVVVDSHDVAINTMTLRKIHLVGTSTAVIGARIYSGLPTGSTSIPSGSLLLANTLTVSSLTNSMLTVPMSFTLKANQWYRIGFYIKNPAQTHSIVTIQYFGNGFGGPDLHVVTSGGAFHDTQYDVYPSSGITYFPYLSVGYKTTGIAKNEAEENSTELFPNPASSQFNLDVKKPYTKLKVELINATGQTVKQEEFFNSSDPVISLKDYPSGIYFVKLNRDDKLQTIKLIKRPEH